MTILTLAFSMFLGFIGGYFAARIAINQSTRNSNIEHDIALIHEQIEFLDKSLNNFNSARVIDGDIWNANYENVKEFMKQQTVVNTQVDQTLRVIQELNVKPYSATDDEEVLYNAEPEVH